MEQRDRELGLPSRRPRLEPVPDPRVPETLPPDGDATVGEVLRWLMDEAEAEAVVYLRLGPGGEERLLVEPRGLPGPDVTYLARHARDIIVKGEIDAEVNEPTAHARWLGRTGSKILLLRGVTQGEADEALRFARFVIEWQSAPRGEVAPILEQRVRQVPGIAWAEAVDGDPPTVRILYARDAEPSVAKAEVLRALGPAEARVEEVEPSASEEPRVRLIDLNVDDAGDAAVDVLLDWKGQTLRGRARGKPTAAGRSYASALAVADAMKPLLESDVEIEGLFRTDGPDQDDVLVVTIRVGGQRYVGAVTESRGEEDVGGARAVLDALNRRLPQIAGRSGRI